jgi:hypothetical protein
MNKLNQQLPEYKPAPQLPPHKLWFTSHYLWGYAFLALSFLLAVAFMYQIEYGKKEQQAQFCIQVITPAKNPQTGEVRDFPTPCDVPEGWEKTESITPSLTVTYEIIPLSSDINPDFKLVKKVSNVEEVIISSIKAILPRVAELQIFSVTESNIHFISIIPRSDAPPQGLYSYNFKTKKLSENTASRYFRGFNTRAKSPAGSLVAMLDDPGDTQEFNRIAVIDLDNQSVSFVGELKEDETYNYCIKDCFGGISGVISWIWDDTIQVSVFDKTKEALDQYGNKIYARIEERTYKVK